MPEGTVIRQHFQVTSATIKKMAEFKSESTHVHIHERFIDTADLFLLINDVYLTRRMSLPGGEEWVLKETHKSDRSDTDIYYAITKGEQEIIKALGGLFGRFGRAWDPKWTRINQICERTISHFETERFFVRDNHHVWLDIARWRFRGNEGLYAVLTTSITSSFDHEGLAELFGPDQMHYAPSKVIASLVQVYRDTGTNCEAILSTKPYCTEARKVLQEYRTDIYCRLDPIHAWKPYPPQE